MHNENDIIQAIVGGSKQAFALLYEKYADKVYNTALSYSKSIEDAEEITQDVFIQIYKNLASFKNDSSLNTWIYRITVNVSYNLLKKKKRITLFKNTFTTTPMIEFIHPGAILEKKEEVSILFKVMDHLPHSQKTAFILSYIEDLPRQEVANIMETSLKAVESLLQRAKKNMRSELEKMYPHRRISRK